MRNLKKLPHLFLTFVLILEAVTPVFAASPKVFTDVNAGQWHYIPVMQAAELGLVNGYEDGRFGPDENITRAQMMQLLYARYGTDMGTASGFSDVPENAWFAKAITWAVDQKLITPISADHFEPNAALSREAMVYGLYALAGSPAVNPSALNPFTDKDTVADDAKDAFAWTVSKNIVSGVSSTELEPKGNATRAQVAVIMTRYLQNIDGVTLPEIEEPPAAGGDYNGITDADAVNGIHNVGKDSDHPTGGSASAANANGYHTEADVYIGESILRYDLLDELNQYLAGLGYAPAAWVTIDEAEEYTLMRAHEASVNYNHIRPDGSPTIAPEALDKVIRGTFTAHDVMNTWINSPDHRRLLHLGSGSQVCFAKSGNVWIMTVWTDAFNSLVVQCAPNDYFEIG